MRHGAGPYHWMHGWIRLTASAARPKVKISAYRSR